jgi:RsiW-degrading membrane proteinase PrsW (M82 family)
MIHISNMVAMFVCAIGAIDTLATGHWQFAILLGAFAISNGWIAFQEDHICSQEVRPPPT